MFRFLSIIFLAGAVLELASIIWVGGKIGVFPTLLLLLAGGVVGISLFRSAGTNATAVLRSSIQDQKIVESLAGTTMVRVFAGVLFLIPGFFSDLAGVVLLVLPVQKWIGVKVQAGERQASGPFRNNRRFGTVIEDEAVEVVEDATYHEADDKRP